MSEYAGIHILDAPYHIDHEFDYFIPPQFRSDLFRGDFVAVPFGTSNRRKLGIVVSLKDSADNKNIECKPIVDVCDKSLSLSDELLGLCEFLKEHTLCSIGDAVKVAVPIATFSKLEEIFLPTSSAGSVKDETADLVLQYISAKGSARLSLLKSKFGPATESAVKKLLSAGLIYRDFELNESSEKSLSRYSLAISTQAAKKIALGDNPSTKLRSEKQKEVLAYLADASSSDGEEEKVILTACGAAKSHLTALVDKGLVAKHTVSVNRNLEFLENAKRFETTLQKDIVLNDEQSAAYDKLKLLSDDESAKAALLFGVTGSGKTSVMMKIIDHTLKKGKGVILLLPEIALTPQSLSIFYARYGKRVAVLHSALSLGEKFDAHKRIKRGEADLVIGTRSAIFAPVKDLGLIIIDEEHEHTYKSDMNPKYHTRDVARYRCYRNNALMLLASATPSFESYKKAKEGTYELITLKNRYGGATLPGTVVVDMREEIKAGNPSLLSSLVCEKLVKNTREKNQSILFLNRRGYNNFISCRTCGEVIKCPVCSVSMTYHTEKRSYGDGYLSCHWCGRRMPLPAECPSCNNRNLLGMGYGTQRIEQEITELLPMANIIRMDTDTTSGKDSYEQMLSKFRNHEADVLLGTQMVTKGHDFPDVTLVGVLLADSSLHLDDYRASERTFAMLTQVIGRAGRSKKSGIAVIQTNNPDSECIKLACRQDYESFYETEIKLRKLLVFPPFCDIALVSLSSSDEQGLLKASTMLSEKLTNTIREKYAELPFIVYGPFEAPIYKVENKYRMRMVIKCSLNKRTRAMFSEILCLFEKSLPKNITISMDFNPSNI